MWASVVGSFESIASSSLRSVFVVLISDFKYLLLAPISPHYGAGDQHWDALAVYITGKEAISYVRTTQNDGKGCRAVSECRKRSPNARHFSSLSEFRNTYIFALGAIAVSWPNERRESLDNDFYECKEMAKRSLRRSSLFPAIYRQRKD